MGKSAAIPVATLQPHAVVYRRREPPLRNRFAPAAVGTSVSTSRLGLGIGGTTAVFGLINARLFSGSAHARAHNL